MGGVGASFGGGGRFCGGFRAGLGLGIFFAVTGSDGGGGAGVDVG